MLKKPQIDRVITDFSRIFKDFNEIFEEKSVLICAICGRIPQLYKELNSPAPGGEIV